MPWWDKAKTAVQGAAEKASFETNKLMRVQTEERALNELRGKGQARLVDLGKAALELYRAGTLTDPAVAGIAQDILLLEQQVGEQQAKVEAVRAEQFQPSVEAAPAAPAAPPPMSSAPAYTPPAPPVAPFLPEAPAAPAAPAMIECPNCHTQAVATAAFCPECGQRLR